jgi:small ligand-binding sensory domain FIST
VSHSIEIATGISYSSQPVPEHARRAVENALEKVAPAAGIEGVLLFLTNGYARSPDTALKNAARAASSTQIIGCCSAGILTEEEWLLDAEGAAAMIFIGKPVLQPFRLAPEATTLLNLSCPPFARISIDQAMQRMVGAVTSDDYGQGPYSVWHSGRTVDDGYVLAGFDHDIKSGIAVAQGIRRLSQTMEITGVDGSHLVSTDGEPAIKGLMDSIPANLRDISMQQPHHILCAISETKSRESIEKGFFKLRHVVATDPDTGHVGLTGGLRDNHHIFWAIRDEAVAQETHESELEAALAELGRDPQFALIFPSISRGPGFYGGRDRDIEILRMRFPDLPIIGFYSNGEIAPGLFASGLLHQYSTVTGLFAGV